MPSDLAFGTTMGRSWDYTQIALFHEMVVKNHSNIFQVFVMIWL